MMSFYSSLDALCGSVLGASRGIQSVSVISKMGKLVESASRPEFSKRFPDYLDEHMFMQCVLQISMGRDFDDDYGPINYHMSERASLTMLTFPVEDCVMLVACDKNSSPITLAKKIIGIINVYRKQVSAIET